MKKLTVVVPIFNEERVLLDLLSNLEIAQLSCSNTEFLVVNDGSTDGSEAILTSRNSIKFLNLPSNLGKGGAVRAGVFQATTEFTAVFDGDLEYGIGIIKNFDAIVEDLDTNTLVFASRYLEKNIQGARSMGVGWSSIVMNRILKFLYKILFGVHLTDPLTGAKLYPTQPLKALRLKRNGFDADHEIALKLAKKGLTFFEIPVDFVPRTKADGKKIRARDGLFAVRTVIMEFLQQKGSAN